MTSTRTSTIRRRISEQECLPVGSAARTISRSYTRVLAALLLSVTLPGLIGWFDPPGDRAAEGNRLFEAGKYEEAASKYGEGLVDAPESPLLQFNLGTALYKQGKYAEAVASLSKVAASTDAAWSARAAYNLGNAQYRLGANAEANDPQAALASYGQALVSYKHAMAAAPNDADPKFNHEFVSRKLAELKKRLEEQQKQQNEEQQEPQEQGQQQEQPQQEQAQQQEQGENRQEQAAPEESQEQPAEGQQQEQAQQQQGGGEEQQQQAEPSAQQAAGGGAAEEKEESPNPDQQAARAVLDTARQEELGPEDIKQPMAGVAGIGEPAQDW